MYGYATGAYPPTPTTPCVNRPPSLPGDRENFSGVLPQRERKYHGRREAEARERHASGQHLRDRVPTQELVGGGDPVIAQGVELLRLRAHGSSEDVRV